MVSQQSIFFDLEKSARQGDPISAYLFTLALEILFLLIKNDSSIKLLKFLTVFLYTAYAYDSTFFLKDLASVKKITRHIFLLFRILWS